MSLLNTVFSSLLVLLVGCERSDGNVAHAAHQPAVTAPELAPQPAAPAGEVTSADSPPLASVEARPTEAKPRTDKPAKPIARTVYVCPMHPEVVSEQPGVCPKCNMKLEPKPKAEAQRSNAAAHAGHAHAEDVR